MTESDDKKTYALFANPANRKLIAELKKTAARVFQFPPIHTEKIESNESINNSIRNLANFDWLIFPEVLAVDYFLEILEEKKIDFFELDDLRICVFGEAVSDRLRFAAVHADVISASVETEIVFAAMVDYIGERELKNLQILFPKERSDNNALAEKLRTSGAEVLEFPIYKTKIENKLEITKLRTLFEGGAIDEFIFTAPTDFIALKHYFKTENLKDIFTEIKLSTADAVNFQIAKEHKLETVGLYHLDKLGKVKR